MNEAITVNELHTLVAGLAALVAGGFLTRKVRPVRRLGLPISVLGGVLASGVFFALWAVTGREIVFATGLRDVFLLVFFTTVGLSARLSSLRRGGWGVAVLCGVTVLLLVLQDLIGIGIALLRGAHPFYGLLAGSLSFVGGPGTAIAWAAHARELGLPLAGELALGSATIATLAGALVAAPLTGWLIRRRGLAPDAAATGIPWDDGTASPPPPPEEPLERYLAIFAALFLLALAVAAGQWLNGWASGHGVLLPGFLTAMLAGVAIANVLDAFGISFAAAPMESAGAISLQLFLVLSLMGLRLWAIGRAIAPLLLNTVLQIGLAGAIAMLLLYRLLGKDYDAAVTAGGFMGFGLASMPVAFATMEEVTAVHGPSPRAFLLITVVGSFFVDLANATITKLFLLLPIFR